MVHTTNQKWVDISYIVHPSCNWTSRTCPVSDRIFVQTPLSRDEPTNQRSGWESLGSSLAPDFLWNMDSYSYKQLLPKHQIAEYISDWRIFWFRTPNTLVYFKRTWLYPTYKLRELASRTSLKNQLASPLRCGWSDPAKVPSHPAWELIPNVLQGGAPQVMFVSYNPINYRYITNKNHSYWSYLHQLSYRTGAPLV